MFFYEKFNLLEKETFIGIPFSLRKNARNLFVQTVQILSQYKQFTPLESQCWGLSKYRSAFEIVEAYVEENHSELGLKRVAMFHT